MKKKSNTKKFIIFLNGKDINSNVQVVFNEVKSTNQNKIKTRELYVVDGGLNYVLKNKINFNKLIWVGDRDSLNSNSMKLIKRKSLLLSNNFIEITEYNLNKDKNYSDFAKLLDIILLESKENQVFLEIFYGLGGRKDHEISNILEVERFISLLPEGGICYFHGGVIISSVSFEMSKTNKMKFSVFGKNEICNVKILGAEYSGQILLERPSHGLSNKAKLSRIQINPQDKSLISIYFNEK